MASGLQTLFGLDDPQREFPNDQSKQFSEDFKREMKAAADAMAYTAQNADEQVHAGLVSRGEAAYGDYQDTQKKIEAGGDEAQIKKEIKKVLEAVKALAGDAGKLKAETEAAKQAWDALAGEKSKADGQIDELDAWDHKNAAKLLQVRQKIDGDAGARRWAVATKTLEALLPKLGPLYEDYPKQKQAKEDYDKERPALDKDFQAAEGYPDATEKIKAQAGEIRGKLDAADAKAKESDFVSALDLLKAQASQMKALQETIEEHKRLKQEYETLLKELEPRIAKTDPPIPGETAAKVAASIASNTADAKASADAGEYEQAIASLGLVKDSLAGYEELVAQHEARKAEYEKRLGAMEPGLETAAKEIKEASLKALQDKLLARRDEMQQAASEEDFEAALDHTDYLEAALETYLSAVEELEKKRAEYDQRVAELEPRIAKTGPPIPGERAEKVAVSIANNLAAAKASAEKEEFPPALTSLEVINDTLAGYEELVAQHEARKAEYEKQAVALKPRLEKAAEEVASDELKKFQEILTRTQQEMEQAGGEEDYEQALAKAGELEGAVTSYESALAEYQKKFEEYKTRVAELDPRIENVTPPIPGERGKKVSDSIVKERADAKELSDAGDYDAALAKLEIAEHSLAGYEELVEQHEARKAEYETRSAALKPRLEKASAAEIKKADLKSLQGKVADAAGKMEEAAQAEDYERAIECVDYLEAALEAFEAGLTELEKERKVYEERLKALEPRVAKTAPPIPGKAAAGVAKSVMGNWDLAKASAEEEEYDTALDNLDTVAESLAGYEKLVEQHEARKAEYENRSAALKPRLEKAASAEIKKADLKSLQGKVADAAGKMEEAAQAEDYERAIECVDYLEAALEAFEAGLTELEKERKVYEERLKALEPRVAKTAPPIPGKAAAGVAKSVMGNWDLAKASAEEEEYDTALDNLDTVAESLAGYEKLVEQHEARKAEYEKRVSALTPRLEKAMQEVNSESLQLFQKTLMARWEEVDEGAASGDYDEALERLGVLEAALKSYESAFAAHQEKFEEYKKRMAELDPRIAKATPPIPGARAAKVSASLVATRQAAHDAADKGDYPEALVHLDAITHTLAGYEELVANHLARKADFEKRQTALKPRLEKAAEPVGEQSLKDLQAKFVTRRAQMEEAAAAQDYETALDYADYLEAALKTYESAVEEHRKNFGQFKKRMQELDPRIAKTKPPIPGERAKKVSGAIARNLTDARAAADKGQYEDALATLEVIDDALAGYEELVERHEARKADFKARLEKLKPRLDKAAKPQADPGLKGLQGKIKARRQMMAQAADREDFQQALDHADYLAAVLATYESGVSQLDQQAVA